MNIILYLILFLIILTYVLINTNKKKLIIDPSIINPAFIGYT